MTPLYPLSDVAQSAALNIQRQESSSIRIPLQKMAYIAAAKHAITLENKKKRQKPRSVAQNAVKSFPTPLSTLGSVMAGTNFQHGVSRATDYITEIGRASQDNLKEMLLALFRYPMD